MPKFKIHSHSYTSWRQIPSVVGAVKQAYLSGSKIQRAQLRNWMVVILKNHLTDTRHLVNDT